MELQAEPQTRQKAIKALERHILAAPNQRAQLLLKTEQLPDYMSEQRRLLKALKSQGPRA